MTESDPPSEENGEFDPPTGPDETDLPEDTPDPEEIDPFEEDPAEFDDINDFVTAEWAASTKARQRVRDVIRRATDPVSVARVADLADVSKPTARDVLNDLSGEGIVLEERRSNGTVYQRHPEWHRYRRLQRYLEISNETLEAALRKLEQEIESYREAYEVESPEELVLAPGPVDDDTWADISEWRTALIDAEYLRTALQLDRLRRVEDATTHSGSSEEDDQLSVQ